MILDVNHVGIRFGGVAALDDVSMTVAAGEIVGLLGPNGAGKTTLFNMIAGVVTPDSGSVSFDGAVITERSAVWRSIHGIARTFQITQPFIDLSVRDNVIVGALRRGGSRASLAAEADELLEFVGLMAKRDALASSLSTGQRKRLELARALATRPRVMLLDEVTGGVDRPSIPALVSLVASLRDKGMTIVLVEHNMEIVSKLCDRLLFLDRGKLLVTGTPDVVLNHPDVVELYLGKVDA